MGEREEAGEKEGWRDGGEARSVQSISNLAIHLCTYISTTDSALLLNSTAHSPFSSNGCLCQQHIEHHCGLQVPAVS